MTNLLLRELETQRQTYNQSFLIHQNNTEHPIKDPFYQIYETCRQFELAHEKDTERGEIYVGDDAFPDSYNHQTWLYHQKVNTQELEWIKAKTKKMWKLIK